MAEPHAPRGEAVQPDGSPAEDHYIPGQVRPPSLNTASKEEEEVFVCLSVCLLVSLSLTVIATLSVF